MCIESNRADRVCGQGEFLSVLGSVLWISLRDGYNWQQQRFVECQGRTGSGIPESIRWIYVVCVGILLMTWTPSSSLCHSWGDVFVSLRVLVCVVTGATHALSPARGGSCSSVAEASTGTRAQSWTRAGRIELWHFSPECKTGLERQSVSSTELRINPGNSTAHHAQGSDFDSASQQGPGEERKGREHQAFGDTPRNVLLRSVSADFENYQSWMPCLCVWVSDRFLFQGFVHLPFSIGILSIHTV